MVLSGNEQVQPPIAVNVGENRPARDAIGQSDTGGQGYILKPHVAQISVEGTVAREAAEKDVRQTIAVEIARGQTCAIEQRPIGSTGSFLQRVREVNPGLIGCEEREAS